MNEVNSWCRKTGLSVAIAAALTTVALAASPGNTQGQEESADREDNTASARGLEGFAERGDIVNLPRQLKRRLTQLAKRPHTYLPAQVFAEATKPSQLFQYYLVDTRNFQPNVFTNTINGINDGAVPTATGANRDRPAIGAIRLVLEPKPGLPTDPNDVRAFIDIFTDVSGLFVINNESGWYEGWMIRDVPVPPIASPRNDGSGNAQYGKITQADADAIRALGSHNNVPGNFFTFDGNPPRFGSLDDKFPDPARTPNILPFPVSLGTFNASQQSDIHAYWEFNPSTNWVFPHYELPFTGGVEIPGPSSTFAAGLQYGVQSLIAGSGPSGVSNNKITYGDNPDDPRDPDRGLVTSLQDLNRPQAPNPTHLEVRNRFIPSGLTEEVLLSAFVRIKSFEPHVTDVAQRLFDAYAKEIARVDKNRDGVISFVEADVNGTSDGLPNTRLYIPATGFNRYAMTREINDGLLAPRFAPSQRAYVQSGLRVLVNPSVPASVDTDNDLR